MEDLKSFQQQHETDEVIRNNIKWTFYDLGNKESDFAVVFLHGTTGSEEIFWIPMQSLMNKFRIVSFNLPPIIGVNELSEGIQKILDTPHNKYLTLPK